VTGVDDSMVDDNVTYNILIGPTSSSDVNYEGLNVEIVEVVNINNDLITSFDPGSETFLWIDPKSMFPENQSNDDLEFLVNLASDNNLYSASIDSSPKFFHTEQLSYIRFKEGDSLYQNVNPNIDKYDNLSFTVLLRPISVSSSHWNGWNNVITRKILTDGKPLFNFGLHPEGWIAITRFDGDCESCVLEHEYYFSRSDSELLLVNYILNRSDEKVIFMKTISYI
jgi:hypothetical protein